MCASRLTAANWFRSAPGSGGETLTVMGPSGSGKSTLLAYLGGFLDPGFFRKRPRRVDGVDLTQLEAEKRHAGILFQDPLLFPHLSVADNIAIAIPADSAWTQVAPGHGRGGARGCRALRGSATAIPTPCRADRKARVALQRVLLSQPRLLLLDEPFSKLDANLRDQTRQMVSPKARRRRTAGGAGHP
jgi:putative thiamine transport system ATP-binding protein